jgi:hemolysin III
MYKNARDPISFLTHLLGAIGGLVLVIFSIIYIIVNKGNFVASVSMLIFFISITLLYSASSIYHYIQSNNKYFTFFHKLDHAMIYVLIAGSYTPFCLTYLEGGKAFISIMWIIAIIGIIGKIFWLNAPRVLYTLLYVLMGWAIVIKFPQFPSVPTAYISLITAGGISYTVGAIIYIFKKPNINKYWGFHELFHLFILLGTIFHVIANILFIL